MRTRKINTIAYFFIIFNIICLHNLSAQADCNSALPISIGNTTYCINAATTTFSADMTAATSSGITYSCDPTANQDFWYSFTAPADGEIMIFMVRDVPATIFPDIVIHSGTCGSLTEEQCFQGFTVTHGQIISGLTPGGNYFFQLANNTADPGIGSVDLCIQENVCNDPLSPSNDCTTATLIDLDQPYSGSTFCNFDPDVFVFPTAYVLDGCNITIENNSWYTFVASEESIDVDYSVTNCGIGGGIQLALLAGTCVDNTTMLPVPGACAVLAGIDNTSSTSNVPPGIGTVTFAGLTPGSSYYIMVDGLGGDLCFFSFDVQQGCDASVKNFIRE